MTKDNPRYQGVLHMLGFKLCKRLYEYTSRTAIVDPSVFTHHIIILILIRQPAPMYNNDELLIKIKPVLMSCEAYFQHEIYEA